MEVICDTNIWYGIASGKLNADKLLDSVELVATCSSLYELSKSHKLYTSPLEVKNAAQALFKYASSVVSLAPLPYIRALDQPGWKPEIQSCQDRLVELQKLIGIDDLSLTKKIREQREQIRQLVTEHTRDLEIANDSINSEILPVVRERIKQNFSKQNYSKQQYRQRDHSGEMRELLQDCVRLETGYTLSEHFDWGKIELMMRVWELFYEDLGLSKMRLRPNDWYDHFNMVYVDSTRRYWTTEEKWIRYVKRVGLSRYLFDPQPNQ